MTPARSARSPWALLLVALAAGCPAGPPAGPPPPASALAAVQARGKLVIAMDVGYDPFEVTRPDGSIVGYDVDLAREVAKDLGVEVELKHVDWDGIIGELRTGKVDAIFSGMSITEERRKAVAFSRPYYRVGQVVVKRKGDARIRGYRDLDDPAMKVATQFGTTGEQAIRRMMPKAEVLALPKADEACLALIQGKADAVVFDHPFLIKYVTEQTDRLEGLWEPFTEEEIAAALRPESQDLLEAIDRTLQRLEASGELAALQARWFPPAPGRAGQAPAGDGAQPSAEPATPGR